LGVKFKTRSGDKPIAFNDDLTNGLHVRVSMAAEATVVPGVSLAQAGVSIEFADEGAFLFHAVNCYVDEIEDKVTVGKALIELKEKWDLDWSVVDTVVRAGSTTVLVSNSQNAKLELRAKAAVEVSSLANPELGLEVVSKNGDVTHFLAEKGLTPLFRVSKFHRSWLEWVRGKPKTIHFGGTSAKGAPPEVDVLESVTLDQLKSPTTQVEATTPVSFGGKIKHPNPMPREEYVRSGEAFGFWLMTVWVNQNPVPTEPEALHKFDVDTLTPEYWAYFGGGGQLPERGASLEELWLGGQLPLRTPMTCLLNVAQPEQEVARITRLRRLSAAEIWSELEHVYANPVLDRPFPDRPIGICPLTMPVYDGADMAHCIVAWTIHENELHFQDPWPERSLLCAEHNSAGVEARESNLIRPGWRITRSEFERVVFAVFLYTPADLPPGAWERRRRLALIPDAELGSAPDPAGL
jgi:hypothetical protein